MPSYQDLEQALDAIEAYVAAQIPIITGSIRRLTDDLRRYGPPELPEIPSFPIFVSVPPPPPPPPALPPTLGYRMSDWAAKHKYSLMGSGILVGLGLAAASYTYRKPKTRILNVGQKRGCRGNDVVVVLGADSELGPIIISDLRARGYIIIASVSVVGAVAYVESLDKGYIKALVLDPYDPTSTTPFLRSLQATLSLKFPLVPGDPYQPPSASQLPVLVSLLSLLSLTKHNLTSLPSPSSPTFGLPYSRTSAGSGSPDITHSLSTLSISKIYLPHLIASHLTPLTIIQSMLPLFRLTAEQGKGPTSIIIALPGGPTSTGLAGDDAAPAMASAAMGKASEILRRELAVSGDPRVVVIDVGELSTSSRGEGAPCLSTRTPTDARRLSEAVIRVVGGSVKSGIGSKPSHPVRALGLQLCTLGLIIRDWWRGDRFSIGAGAATYSMASYLPLRFLDTLILLPRRLLAYRDSIRRRARALKREAQELQKERKRRQQQERREFSLTEGGGELVHIAKPSAADSSIASPTPRSVSSEADTDAVADTSSASSGSGAAVSHNDGRPSPTRSTQGDETRQHDDIGDSWVMENSGEDADGTGA